MERGTRSVAYYFHEAGRRRTKPEGASTPSGNWLFSIEPWPIFRYACAALQRLCEKRPGGQATMTRLLGNSFFTASMGAIRSLSAEMRRAASKAS